MREYLVGQQGGYSESEQEDLRALFTPYLTSVLLPTLGEKGSLRNVRELRTLAEALDALVKGDLEGLGDLLTQRFKALEMATQEGNWTVAKHYELIGDSSVTTASKEDREAALREEAHDARYLQASKR